MGPLGGLYGSIYRRVASATIAAIERAFPGCVESVYSRGSGADGRVVPGISDVDLFFVLSDTVDADTHEAIQVRYRDLAARWPILDDRPWILRSSQVATLYRENPSLRFRVLETRAAGRPVHGSDPLASLPPASRDELALSLLFDVKTRLAYFSAFCLVERPDDGLEARREEYLLYKLTLDLVRASLFLERGDAVFRRDELRSRFRDPSCAPDLSTSAWWELRALLERTRRSRLRRTFARGERAEDLRSVLLAWTIALAERFYALPEIRSAALLANEAEQFYGDGVFRPTGRRVVWLAAPDVASSSFATLREKVGAANASGRDAVVARGDLWINLSNADPGIGHCSVVDRSLVAPQLAESS